MPFCKNISIGWSNIILLVGFCVLAYAVSVGATADFDRSTVIFFRGFLVDRNSELLQEILRDITSLGSMTILFAIIMATAGYLAFTGHAHNILTLLIVSIGGLLIISALKWGFARPRPDLAVGGVKVFTTSFPSEHAALSTMVYLTIAKLITSTSRSPRVSLYCFSITFVLIAFIGISRICLGLHYPTDIFCGWSIGAAWALSWRYDEAPELVPERLF